MLFKKDAMKLFELKHMLYEYNEKKTLQDIVHQNKNKKIGKVQIMYVEDWSAILLLTPDSVDPEVDILY